MATKQQKAYALLSKFDELYEAKYGRKYSGNRHADKWGFIDMLTDLGEARTKEVLEYYFKTSPSGGHSRQHLHYHYHEYHLALEQRDRELERKRKILQQMKETYEG